MSCPICDNKPANCDCSSDAIRYHEEVENLAGIITGHIATIEGLEKELFDARQEIKDLKLQLSALASEAKNAVSWLHGCAPHASDPGHVRKLADRLWALADKAEGKGSVA